MTLISKTEQAVGEARATVAVNDDDVQAGYNDTGNSTHAAGGFVSFPSSASLGSFKFYSSNQGGNYASSLTNAAFGQATALTIQDPGVSAANISTDNGLVAAGTGADSPGSLTGVTETLVIKRAGVTYYIPLYAVNT